MDVSEGVAGLGGRPEGDAADCVLGVQTENQTFEIVPGYIPGLAGSIMQGD